MKYVLILLAFFICSCNAFADEAWQPAIGIKESDIKEAAVEDGIIYASSGKSLYRSADNGEMWNVVFTVRRGGSVINFIAASDQGVFACTDNGLYKSSDGKSRWDRIFKGVGVEENNTLHIAFSRKKGIYLGTGAGLFTSNDNGATWQKDPKEAGSLSIRYVSFLDDIIFIAAETGVYKKTSSGWKRVFVTETEETEYDSDSSDAAESAIRPVNSMFTKDKDIFLATDNGIFISKNKGESWDRFISNGLLSQRVNRLIFEDNLYAATDKGVFVFLDNSQIWEAVYKGMAGDKANSISADDKGGIWVATNKGLYTDNAAVIASSPSAPRDDNGKDILKLFSHESTIREVQETAIRYAEVHPDKIERWRRAAKKKAILPNVSVGLDRYITDYWHWDAGANPDVLMKGDDAISWDVTATWNLGELIWNDDQTSIDTRSRLMVQLRDDVLDEITRTYFERRRLQIESHFFPPESLKEKIDKELRIDELTADLDAMTGGQFSRSINHNR